MKFSELAGKLVYGRGMKRIGKLVDIDVDLEGRTVKQLVVKVDGREARQAWRGKLSLRSPKISIPAESVVRAKDAVQLGHTLEELKSSLKKT